MKKIELKDIKIGKYYLVDLNKEMRYNHLGKLIGKVIYIDKDLIRYKFSKSYQNNILIEFIEENENFHNGLSIFNYKGKQNHCYYVAKRGIIREVPKIEVFGEIL